MPKIRSRLVAGGLCLLLALPLAAAAAPEASPLTLEQIMADPDWIGNPPEDPYWSDDGRSVYYEREREGIGKQRKDLYRVDLGDAGRPALGRARPARPGRTRRGSATASGRARSTWSTATSSEGPQDRRRAPGHPHGRGGERAALPGRRPARLVPPRRPTSSSTTSSPGLLSQPADAAARQGPGREGARRFLQEQQTRLFDVIRQKQDQEKREREEDRALGEADPSRAAAPLVPGQGGQDREHLPLPLRRLAGGGHRAEAGRGRVQAVEDAAVRHRERQRRDPGRAPQGRRARSRSPTR